MGNELMRCLSVVTNRKVGGRFSLLVSLGILLALTSVAQAGTVYITFVSGSGQYQGSQQVGPYNLKVDNQPVKLVCDDIVHTVSPGQSWTAYMSTGLSDLSHVRFSGGVQAYGAAAWLLDQGYQHPTEWGDVNFAIWALFNPTQTKNTSGWSQGAQNLLTTATSQTYTANQFAGLEVFTPTDPTSPQEYIVLIPEPSTVLLLSSGFVGLVLFARRKR